MKDELQGIKEWQEAEIHFAFLRGALKKLQTERYQVTIGSTDSGLNVPYWFPTDSLNNCRNAYKCTNRWLIYNLSWYTNNTTKQLQSDNVSINGEGNPNPQVREESRELLLK